MSEQFRQQPENPRHNAPESGAGSIELPPPPSPEHPVTNPTDENEIERSSLYGCEYKAEEHNVTAIFNSFIRGFLGNEKKVDRMLKEGRIIEEEALQKKKAASRRKQESELRANLNSMVENGYITREELVRRVKQFRESHDSEK